MYFQNEPLGHYAVVPLFGVHFKTSGEAFCRFYFDSFTVEVTKVSASNFLSDNFFNGTI